MNSVKRIGLLLWLFLSVLPLSGSSDEPLTLQQSEMQLKVMFTRLARLNSYTEKGTVADSLSDLLHKTLLLPGSFEYPFDSLKTLGKIKSQDQKIRIYTWNFPDISGTNTYYGFLQHNAGKSAGSRIFQLTDNRAQITDPVMATLTPDNWYGCLVYGIIEKNISGTTIYTLLGYNPENLFISKKIIDVLWFNDQNEPVFGKTVLHYQNRMQNRILFEYSAKVNMSLLWNEKMNMIVFDHLSPSKSSYTGNYQYYGPDFTYDGFRFDQGTWEHVTDIDIRNK
ncbi:MAG: hypothetical protein JW830_05005 [Bacteroidales bacterium]|nr:hypothetical protein [Bacteroidales bacterium]